MVISITPQLHGVDAVDLLGEVLAAVAQLGYFWQLYELGEGAAVLLEDDLSHVDRLALGDPVPEDADDILKPYPILIVNPLKQDLKVVNDVLFED